MPTSQHSAEEWLAYQPLIEYLYLDRKRTMLQVRDYLRGIGFNVNERMVKTKVLNWNLHKKLQLPEMRTALKLLGPERSEWPSEAPRFRIRRRLVGLDEILRSFVRRNIMDPFDWTSRTRDEDYMHSSNVELFTVHTPDGNVRDFEDVGHISSELASTFQYVSGPLDPASPAPEDSCVTVSRRNLETPIEISWPLYPDIYIQTATAVRNVQSYCSRYMASPGSGDHQEPAVHHLTCHAKFLDRMDEGISLFGRGEMDLAFEKFKNGFKLLETMLRDLHPMAIATYLLLLCKLTASGITPVSANLLEHAYKLAGAISSVPDHLVELLRSILRSGEFSEMPIRCLEAASDVLETNAAMHWKTLYVKERHCDALYHAKIHGEAAMRRIQLLKLQEVRYDPSARNVLWTSLNVADDHLTHGQLEEAEERFTQVARQSEQHMDYHRAKSLVVALEGLAKVARIRGSKEQAVNPDSAGALQNLLSASRLLQRALRLLHEAIELAQAWFENASRRIQRLLDLRDAVQLDHDSLPFWHYDVL